MPFLEILTSLTEVSALPDVVVIGSGAGGSAVAGELARRGAHVLVVEAGDEPTPARPLEHLRNQLDDQPSSFGREIRKSLHPHGWSPSPPVALPGARVAHAPGGGLRYWTHHCPTPYDDEWPLDRAHVDVDDLLGRARELLGVGEHLRGGRRHERIISALREEADDDERRPVAALPVAGVVTPDGRIRYTGAGDLLRGDAGAGRVQLLGGHAARAVARSAGQWSTEVGPTGGGEPRTLRAPTVVVAAGALGAAQLLRSSRLGGDNVGRWLTDHAMAACRVRLSAAVLDGADRDDREFAVWVPVSEHRRHHLQVVRSPVAPDGSASFPAPTEADVVGFAPVEPDPANRLVFGPGLDGLGLSVTGARFRHSAADRASIVAMTGAVQAAAVRIGGTESGWSSALAPIGASVHLMGTVRMARGEGPATTVCDDTGRLWAEERLYVAGNGVLGSANAGNPTLMTVALGLRTADAICAG